MAQEMIEVIPGEAGAKSGGPNLLNVAPDMILWTWVTFAIVAFLLYKFAWKPILTGLDQRETYLRDAVENAQKVQHELDSLEDIRGEALARTAEESKELLAQARKAAAEVARLQEQRSKEESQILLDIAKRDIQSAQDKASNELRRVSAEAAVQLAARILGEEMDEAKNQALTDKLLQEI